MFRSQLKKEKKIAVILPGHSLGLDSPRQRQFHLEVAITELDPSGNNGKTEGDSGLGVGPREEKFLLQHWRISIYCMCDLDCAFNKK